MGHRVLVILTVYNGMPYLKKQIRSILNQQDVVVDIFVNLDISTDRSNKLISKISKNNKHVTYSKERKYGSSFQNFINACKSTRINNYSFIAFSDHDDVWEKFKLINAIKVLEKGYDAYSSNVTFWNENNNKKKLIKKSVRRTSMDHFFEAPGPTSTIVLKKDLFVNFRKNIESNFHNLKKVSNFFDIYIYCFSIENEYKWFIDKNSFILYRQHDNNELGYRYSFNSLKKRFKLIINLIWINDLQKIWIAVGSDGSLRVQKSLYSFKSFIKNIFFKFYLLRRSFLDKYIFFFIIFISFILLRIVGVKSKKFK